MKEKAEKTKKKINFKNKKGITLIALVITIVVLLILAGVSIAMLTGNNGILGQANRAKVEQSHGAVKEGISLAYNEWQIEINTATTTKLATTKTVKIQGEEERGKSGTETTFLGFLKNKKYIREGTENVLDVEKLIGSRQALGNGTEENDVYKIERERGGYILKYYGNNTEAIILWQVETFSDEDIFVYDETADGIEIVGIDFTKLECEEEETEFGIYAKEGYPSKAIKVKNMETLKIPSTINGKNVISVNFFVNRSIGISAQNSQSPIVTGIEEIIYPETAKIIGTESQIMVIQFVSVTKIELQEGLEEIRAAQRYSYPFLGMTELEEITIPSSVKKISQRAFLGTRTDTNNEEFIINIKGKDSEADFEEPYGGSFLIGWDSNVYATVKYLEK